MAFHTKDFDPQALRPSDLSGGRNRFMQPSIFQIPHVGKISLLQIIKQEIKIELFISTVLLLPTNPDQLNYQSI